MKTHPTSVTRRRVSTVVRSGTRDRSTGSGRDSRSSTGSSRDTRSSVIVRSNTGRYVKVATKSLAGSGRVVVRNTMERYVKTGAKISGPVMRKPPLTKPAPLRRRAGVSREEFLHRLKALRFSDADRRELTQATENAAKAFGYAGRD